MARGRSAGYDAQREAILACAARLFATQGYSATSMNQVAAATGLSKATLYHYWRDKDALLLSMAEAHVSKLKTLVAEVLLLRLTPQQRLRELIVRMLGEYADARHAHRVLTEDVKFLAPADRQRILDIERDVVAGFAEVVGALRPELKTAALTKPMTMLLFGMINWLFTWVRPDGALDHAALAPMVADLFLGGLSAVKLPAGAGPGVAPARRVAIAAARGNPP